MKPHGASTTPPFLRRLLPLVAFAVLAAYVLFLLSNGTMRVFAPELLDQAYNSMLAHMLRGRFDVAPASIGYEAFYRNGHSYAYFGVVPALLRLPFALFGPLKGAHLARLSCWVAIVLYDAALLRMVVLVQRALPAAARSRVLFWAFVAASLLSGPELYLLGLSWIYHESVFWAAALGAAFNLLMLPAVLADGRPSGRALVLGAVLGGLAMEARPTVGLGLCLAVTLLALREALARREGPVWRRVLAGLRDRDLLAVVGVLVLFVAIVGGINFGRWGDPLVFQGSARRYASALAHPRLMTIPQFDPVRAWWAALDYLTGLPWMFAHMPTVSAVIAAKLPALEPVMKALAPVLALGVAYTRAHFDGLETPPLAGPLAAPLAALFVLYGLRAAWRGGTTLRLLLAGYAITVIMVLAFWYTALRYRFDFAVFTDLAAMAGFGVVARAMAAAALARRRRWQGGLVVLAVLGILVSHYELVWHKIWAWGVPMQVREALLPLAPFAKPSITQGH